MFFFDQIGQITGQQTAAGRDNKRKVLINMFLAKKETIRNKKFKYLINDISSNTQFFFYFIWFNKGCFLDMWLQEGMNAK